jgi:hypothetical protein
MSELWIFGRGVTARVRAHSHSIVPGGLEVTS